MVLNNDAAVKARVWIDEFGTAQTVPAGMLAGVFKRHNLEQAAYPLVVSSPWEDVELDRTHKTLSTVRDKQRQKPTPPRHGERDKLGEDHAADACRSAVWVKPGYQRWKSVASSTPRRRSMRHPPTARPLPSWARRCCSTRSAHGGRTECALGSLALQGAAQDGPIAVLIRPEQIVLSEDAAATAACVEHLNYYGHDATIALRCCPQAAPCWRAPPPVRYRRRRAPSGSR